MSKQYTDLVAQRDSWNNVRRKSLYSNSQYLRAAPYAQQVANAIKSADSYDSSIQQHPYVGIQYVAIPEFPMMATPVSHFIARALGQKMSINEAINASQQSVKTSLTRAGYIYQSKTQSNNDFVDY